MNKIGNIGLAALLAGAFLVSTPVQPADAQMSYSSINRHEPIWAVSRYGGYYDCTGVIQGTVAERDLPLYGGRYVDGRPVAGGPKLRYGSGSLMDPNQYDFYRQSLIDRLNRLDQLEARAGAYGLTRRERENIRNERRSLRDQLASLDRSYSNPYYGPPYPDYGIYPVGGSGLSGLLNNGLMSQGLNSLLSRFGL